MYEPKDDETGWLISDQAAQYLDIKLPTLYKWVRERRIPFYKVPGSRKLKFKREELDQLIESGRVQTVEEHLDHFAKD